MTREEKAAIATKIAKAAAKENGGKGKWAAKQQLQFLALVMIEIGIDKEDAAKIVEAADWHGAVLNGSQFAQWADGKEGLGLEFKIRQPKGEAKAIGLGEMLAGLEDGDGEVDDKNMPQSGE